MATGDTADIKARLRALIPADWFPDSAPVVDAVLTGLATVYNATYALILYARAQMRVQTATGGFLDLAAYDFFGFRVKRKPSQTDESFRLTINREVLRARATRPGILQALQNLTGNRARMLEAANPCDTGGWGTWFFALDDHGYWGDNSLPYQLFLDVVQPVGAGIPNISGLDNPQSGYGAGTFFLVDLAMVVGVVTTQDIYDTIEATRAAGVTAWVNIAPEPIVGDRLEGFTLDTSILG